MALDVSGLPALVARGERARCKRVVGGLARVGADGAHRATAAAPASIGTSSLQDIDSRRSHSSSVVWTLRPIASNAGSVIWAECSSYPARVTGLAHLASNCAWVAAAMYV